MKKTTLALALSILGLVSAQAQQPTPPPPGGSWNPYLIEGNMEPRPLLPAEFNGTGQAIFDVGNTGSDPIVWVTGQSMLITISLSYGVPNVTDPSDALDAINAVGGPGAAFFTWEYFPNIRTFRATQAADLPGGGNWRETITIDYKVTDNSFRQQTFQNGYNANIAPPGYTGGSNAVDDDTVAAYTFVEAFDYGDAPSSYGTPRHEINLRKNNLGLYTNYVYLGTAVDPEDASQHSPDATGDDANQTGGLNVDDEDGVALPPMIAGTTVSVPVTFTVWDYDPFENAPGIRIRGWIDWDKNGTFATTGIEVAFDDNDIGTFLENEDPWTGARTFVRNMSVTIPADASGSYFLRTRIGPNTNPTTTASSYGEVEDYMFEIQQVFGSISGTVGADTDGDGIADTFESGVQLTLLDENGNPVFDDLSQPITTVTLMDGSYIFENVPPGTYQVSKTPSGTYVPLSDIDGGDPNLIGVDTNLVGTNITVVGNVENAGNNFLEFLQKCPDTWADWQAKWNTDLGGETGLTENPDGDRYSNLIEYAFCLPPHIGIRKPFCLTPSITVAGAIDGVYTRTAIGGAKDVTYVLEWTASLDNPTTWTGSVVLDDSALTITNDGEGGETVTIPDIETFTLLNGGSGFVRIRVNFDDGVTQATDTTDVLGWVQTDFETCCTTYCNPFLECAVFTGTVDSVSGQDLVLTTSADGFDIATVLDAGVAYYIEVETGTLAGHRFDIASGGVDALTLASDSDLFALAAPFNTIAGAAPSALAGSRIALHRAKTLNMLFPPSGFNATVARATSDEVQVFSGGQWKIYWLFDEDGAGTIPARWVDAADAGNADQGATVIPPGRGLFFNNRDTLATGLLAFGEVREQPFANPLAAGNNLVGGGYPVLQTPVGGDSRELNIGDGITGFFGSRDFKTADSIFRWRADGNSLSSGYDTYFLLSFGVSGDEKWVLQNDAMRNPQDATNIFEGDRSVFQRVRYGVSGYLIPAPWTPDAIIP